MTGFTSQDMGENGLYEQKMKQAIEALLRYEPYVTYRNYLNTYIVKAVSKQNGVTQPGYAAIRLYRSLTGMNREAP